MSVTGESDPTRVPDGHPESLSCIGPYHLLQNIGEGGMGEVWVAEQREPIRRTVAIKVIKIGMDTRQVVARFEAERQALAVMDHPAIAKVLDAGATEHGRPYFVMEYVKGDPITTYCDREQLSTEQRLELFMRVCEGVQHAHQKGIIHRDLKPSNVLVTIQDGQPVPKIIDFGIAKATSHRLTQQTLFTELGVLVGTPEYMSPEQAEMTGVDIDTRTDIYSLGVLLYELLTGTLPFDPKTLREKGLEEIRRTIREADPPRPSTRVTQLGRDSIDAAKKRLTEPARLASRLRGDLDWITMKALEKNRTRRYDTATGLANDVRRHLASEPVSAGPPGTAYRAQKFGRRHRFGVAAGAALVLLLVAFAFTMAMQARRIAEQRDRAERVSAFLVSLFDAAQPDRAKGGAVPVGQLLDKGVERLATELRDEPATRASLLHTIGRVYETLGRHPDARKALEQALSYRQRLSGRDRLALADTLYELGVVFTRTGDYARAEALHVESLEIRRRWLQPDDPATGKSLNGLGNVAIYRGQYEKAATFYREGLPILKKSGKPGEAAGLLLNLSIVYWHEGDLEHSMVVGREALDAMRAALGPDHTWTLAALNSHAHHLYEAGDYATAEQLQRELLATRRRLLGDRHGDVAIAHYNLANTLDEEGAFDEAEREMRESLAISRATLPDPHAQIAWALNDLGIILTDAGRCAEAEGPYNEALATIRRLKEREPAFEAWPLDGLGSVYRCEGKAERSEESYRAALESRTKALGAHHVLVAQTQSGLGWLLIDRGAYDEAEKLVRASLTTRQAKLPSTHWRIAFSQALLGACLAGERRFAEAEPLLTDAYAVLAARRGPDRTETRYAGSAVARMYDAWGKPDKAAEWRKKLPPQ
jgi:eukaryotic-like serine/threonine-protein kinase